MNLSKYDIEQLLEKCFSIQARYRQPAPFQPALDLTPVADAIREGLTAISTSIEYVAQLEDQRLREVNKQGE